MKKIIRKFWGVALVVMLLSTILVLPAAPAAAAAYAFSDTAVLPSAITGVLAPATGFGFVAVAQAGDVIYATAADPDTDGPGPDIAVNYLYKSSDGGATWAPAVATGLPAAPATWNLIAVAPDDANYVVIVNTAAAPVTVYLSTNGGATFANISDGVGAPTAINSIDISALYGGDHYVLAGGAAGAAAYLAKWQIALAAVWTPIAVATAVPVPTSIQAVKYTPFPDTDQGFLFIGKTANDLSLHMYSDAFIATPVDPVGFNYPRVFATGGAVVCTKAEIVLDPNFFIYDNEIGFIGSDVAGGAPAVTGGVWTMVGGLGKIQTLANYNSLAWDGVNMMSGGNAVVGPPAVAMTVYRSANALAGPGVTVFAANAPFKAPGTGTNPLVLFAGGSAYCLSAGEDGGVAKSADLGKSFNGVKLISSTVANPFNNVLDFWVKSDGSVIYALTSDTVNVDLWGMSGGVWQRITMLPIATYNAVEIVRSAQSDTNAIYIARPANANRILKSVDGGTTWLLRSCTQNIADLALQSATVAYVASAASAAVLKTANGCTSWTTVGALGGVGTVGYSISLIADNKLVVGGTAGRVGYYDGTAWTAIALPVAAGNAVVAASGTATGDVIFAGTAAGVGAWTIGTSVAWGVDAAAPAITGLAYANGVLYAFDQTVIPATPPPIIPAHTRLFRYYTPTISLAFSDTINTAATVVFNGGNTINSLQMVTGSNIVYARDSAAAPNTLQSFTEYLLQAVPALSYPVNNAIIPVNSLNGVTNPFNFMWTAPAVTALPAVLNYNIVVYYDAAGLLPVIAFGANTGGTNLGSAGPWAGLFTPGVTYYWSVQITAPVHSLPSAMGSFTIQQLAAIVPVISSPPNGSDVATLTPAFSWEPISGVTSYEFQLARESSFALMEFTDNSSTSSAALPVAKRLADGDTYFWRVRAIAPAVGEWSQVGIFTVAIPVTPTPTPQVTPTFTIPVPSITVTAPQPTVTVIIPTQPTPTNVVEKISPAYIWAIIIIGAVLVIAVIVLIVRTRRTV